MGPRRQPDGCCAAGDERPPVRQLRGAGLSGWGPGACRFGRTDLAPIAPSPGVAVAHTELQVLAGLQWTQVRSRPIQITNQPDSIVVGPQGAMAAASGFLWLTDSAGAARQGAPRHCHQSVAAGLFDRPHPAGPWCEGGDGFPLEPPHHRGCHRRARGRECTVFPHPLHIHQSRDHVAGGVGTSGGS